MEKNDIIDRRQARESAFLLVFEYDFNREKTTNELIDEAVFERELQVNEFTTILFNGVVECIDKIDATIAEHCVKWKIDRIAKPSLALLRVAVYEMLYTDTKIPVVINEAVELAKKYEFKEDASFVNGILGSISKTVEEK